MIQRVACLIILVSVLAACEYEAPLTREHSIPIDQRALGLWEGEAGQMVILPYSETEYLVHYPIENNTIYYRAYPVSIGGVSCVQFEAIGTHEGPVDEEEKSRFHVISYNIADGELEARLLNTKLVDKTLKDSDALRQAFLEHKDDENLFTDLDVFKKAGQ